MVIESDELVSFRLDRLHVKKLVDDSQKHPRRYTLTHSDNTGDLFLTIASDYNIEQISGWYTRFMRDEVLAEWENTAKVPLLHIYCHVSGGLVFGYSKMRESIFRREMELVLMAIRNGDTDFFNKNPVYDEANIIVHYQKSGKDYKIERFGKPSKYVTHS
jgi:hypothetical protein